MSELGVGVMNHITRSDPVFFARLESGWAWETYIAKLLSNQGYEPQVEDFYRRPEEKAEAAKGGLLPDRPDIWLRPGNTYVEVKAKNETFTSPSDFPFSTAWICNVPSLTKARQSKYRRIAMVLVSATTGCPVVVPWRPERWHEEPALDGSYGYPVWAAPKSDLRTMAWFRKLTENGHA